MNGRAMTVTRYEYRQAESETGLATAAWTGTRSSNPEYSVTGLTNGTEYFFQVRADYDTYDDGLIENANLERLNAVRWDLNGEVRDLRLVDVSVASTGATSKSAGWWGPTTARCPTVIPARRSLEPGRTWAGW